MCTIVVASRLRADFPLIVAANRDEFLGRPALPPAERSPGLIAGVDLEKGGTWLGATRAGLFVGLTNQHTEHLLGPAPRSRGEVVLGALEARSLDAALAFLRGLDMSLYNPFNLLLGDATRLVVGYSWRGQRMELLDLPPGLHVLANDALRSPLYPKTWRAARLVEPLLDQPWETLAPGLARALGDHALPPWAGPDEPPPATAPDTVPLPVCDEELRPVARSLQSVCVHTGHGYGTRSASLVAIGPNGLARYLFADGPPCVTPFREV